MIVLAGRWSAPLPIRYESSVWMLVGLPPAVAWRPGRWSWNLVSALSELEDAVEASGLDGRWVE